MTPRNLHVPDPENIDECHTVAIVLNSLWNRADSWGWGHYKFDEWDIKDWITHGGISHFNARKEVTK